MRRLVVTDRIGRIVATGPHPEDVPEMRGKFGFAALEGQSTHEVELPEHVRTIQHLQDLHKTHQVSVDGARARLVPIKREP
jgi:hypothetical protein